MRYKDRVLRKFERLAEALDDHVLIKLGEFAEPFWEKIPESIKFPKYIAGPLYVLGSELWTLYCVATVYPRYLVVPALALPFIPPILYLYHRDRQQEKDFIKLELGRKQFRPDVGESVSKYKQLLERQGAIKDGGKDLSIETCPAEEIKEKK